MSKPQAFVQPVERQYDSLTDRLFLVYYPLPPGFNGNKWGVSPSSIERNIHTAINKPVVVLKKNANNTLHTRQAGMYIHPTPELAQEELGRDGNSRLTAERYYQWQERFAIGRVRSVDKRPGGYAWTLEITDKDAKDILKSDDYRGGIPGWTSPQIISNAGAYPNEEQSGNFEHWAISHVALVDVPAYGKEQAGLRAKCLGVEQDCMIATRSASQENVGFCVKQATIDLVNSRYGARDVADIMRAFNGQMNSSQSAQSDVSSHTTMSQPENTISTTNTGSETVTFTGTPPNQQQQQQPVQAETKEEVAEKQGERDREQSPGQEEQERIPKSAEPQTLQEAQAMVKQMSELLNETRKQLKSQGKELENIRTERKQARLSYIIPRDLFKSDESHLKEVQRTMASNISEEWLIEYWKTKRELAMANTNAKRMEEPIAAKSASLQSGHHDVPDFSSSNSTSGMSNLQKQLELQRMILEGGAG